MIKILISSLLIIITVSAYSQSVSVPRLIGMLNWNATQLDSTLKKDGYLLTKKKI